MHSQTFSCKKRANLGNPRKWASAQNSLNLANLAQENLFKGTQHSLRTKDFLVKEYLTLR